MNYCCEGHKRNNALIGALFRDKQATSYPGKVRCCRTGCPRLKYARGLITGCPVYSIASFPSVQSRLLGAIHDIFRVVFP